MNLHANNGIISPLSTHDDAGTASIMSDDDVRSGGTGAGGHRLNDSIGSGGFILEDIRLKYSLLQQTMSCGNLETVIAEGYGTCQPNGVRGVASPTGGDGGEGASAVSTAKSMRNRIVELATPVGEIGSMLARNFLAKEGISRKDFKRGMNSSYGGSNPSTPTKQSAGPPTQLREHWAQLADSRGAGSSKTSTGSPDDANPARNTVTIGLCLSRHSSVGHPDTVTRQTAFDFNELQDRSYAYVSSTDNHGWLAGGGESGMAGSSTRDGNSQQSQHAGELSPGGSMQSPNGNRPGASGAAHTDGGTTPQTAAGGPQQPHKIAAPDTVHIPMIQIDAESPAAVDGIIAALARGEIFIPHMAIMPEALSVNGVSPPDLVLRFGCERNDDLPPDEWPNWCLEFMHNQLYEYFAKDGARWTKRPFQITLARKVRWKTVKHMNKFFAHSEKVINAWRESGPQYLDPQLSYIEGGATPEEVARPHGIYLLRNGRATNYFAPNFEPPYTTKMTRSLLLNVLGKSWDKKRQDWSSEPLTRLIIPPAFIASVCGCSPEATHGILSRSGKVGQSTSIAKSAVAPNPVKSSSSVHQPQQSQQGSISSSDHLGPQNASDDDRSAMDLARIGMVKTSSNASHSSRGSRQQQGRASRGGGAGASSEQQQTSATAGGGGGHSDYGYDHHQHSGAEDGSHASSRAARRLGNSIGNSIHDSFEPFDCDPQDHGAGYARQDLSPGNVANGPLTSSMTSFANISSNHRSGAGGSKDHLDGQHHHGASYMVEDHHQDSRNRTSPYLDEMKYHPNHHDMENEPSDALHQSREENGQKTKQKTPSSPYKHQTLQSSKDYSSKVDDTHGSNGHYHSSDGTDTRGKEEKRRKKKKDKDRDKSGKKEKKHRKKRDKHKSENGNHHALSTDTIQHSQNGIYDQTPKTMSEGRQSSSRHHRSSPPPAGYSSTTPPIQRSGSQVSNKSMEYSVKSLEYSINTLEYSVGSEHYPAELLLNALTRSGEDENTDNGNGNIADQSSSKHSSSGRGSSKSKHQQRPNTPPPPSDEDLFSIGWAKALDPESNSYYYFTLDRTKIVWDNPLEEESTLIPDSTATSGSSN